jgi:choline dehydrogenase-like flavoprotein
MLPGVGLGSYRVSLRPGASDDALIESMRAGVEAAGQALGAQPADVDVLSLGSSYHEAGGLQMGTSESASVVDEFGRLWAEPRVRVVDASAWPSIGAANPHLTLVAIARRQAERLARDLSGPG